MAVRGTEAKANAIQIIQKAFGDNWIGESEKKYYVWSQENGEKMQVAITLTCPKTPVQVSDIGISFDGGISFGDSPGLVTPMQTTKAEITPEERATVNKLMEALGL